jgi:hypothetical protein
MNIDFMQAGEALGDALKQFSQARHTEDKAAQVQAEQPLQEAVHTAELLGIEADACWHRFSRLEQQEYLRFVGQLTVATQELRKPGRS